MQQYMKLWVVLVGLALLKIKTYFAIDIPYNPEVIVETIIGLGTAFGVFAARNG